MKNFDLIVIGSGSGLEISAEAAYQDLSVAVIEEGPFGGTCLNRGCIPSKMLIHCADVIETIHNAHRFGITARVESIDWRFIMDRTYKEIDADAAGIEEGNRQAPNISVFKGRGRFVGDKTLEVNGESLQADKIVIAAGTRPWVPTIPGLDTVPYLTSDEALRLPEQPARMAIVGGGYIAAELAHFFGSLGTKVTIVHRSPRLLRQEDLDLSQRFTNIYQERFNLLLNTQVTRTYAQDGGIGLDLSTNGEALSLTSDALLFATGRVPNTDLLDVARTGVKVNDAGYVQTDEYMETTVPGVWALGDIVGRYLLKHSANLEATHVANNIFNPKEKVPVDYHAMPHAIFARPQVAGVGATEEELKSQNVDYLVGNYPYSNTAFGSSIEDQDGFVKVLASAKSGELLGCHILGTDASTLIQEAANAMRLRLTVDSITNAIYVHPALPEVVQRAFGSLRHPVGPDHQHQP